MRRMGEGFDEAGTKAGSDPGEGAEVAGNKRDIFAINKLDNTTLNLYNALR